MIEIKVKIEQGNGALMHLSFDSNGVATAKEAALAKFLMEAFQAAMKEFGKRPDVHNLTTHEEIPLRLKQINPDNPEGQNYACN